MHAAVSKLSYAGNEAARRYLNGEIDRAAAVAWLQTWAMTPKDRAEQRTRFFDQYRSYVINYNFGQDLVREYIEQARRHGGPARRSDGRSSGSSLFAPTAVGASLNLANWRIDRLIEIGEGELKR